MVVRKRPCGICRRWFQPDPRAGDRQHVCDMATCQAERHRRACAAYNERERVPLACERLAARLQVPVPVPPADPAKTQSPGKYLETTKRTPKHARPPHGWPATISWPVAQDAVGLQVAVVIAEYSKHSALVVKTQSPANPIKALPDPQK